MTRHDDGPGTTDGVAGVGMLRRGRDPSSGPDHYGGN